jgi:PIN domain nuclease of toxin-antitoxin system
LIVLDTHAFLWWVGEPKRLGSSAFRALAKEDRVGVAAVSCYEVAAAVSKGRISLDRGVLEWLEEALALPRVELLPLTPAIAVKATQLGAFHGDPADRLIVATAVLESATLVTKDAKIRAYPAVTTIW